MEQEKIPLTCERCGYTCTDEDDEKFGMKIHDMYRNEDIFLCPACTEKMMRIIRFFVNFD